jgi:protein SCO1/2
MSGYSRRLQWAVWGLLFLTTCAIGLALVLSQLRLSQAPLAVYGQVPPFRLTNQFNQPVTLDSLRGQVWVADIIFTRCPGPCLKMSREMKRLAVSLSTNLPLKFVSLTADPQFDTPQVLADYAKRLGATDPRWWFLTGPKADL